MKKTLLIVALAAAAAARGIDVGGERLKGRPDTALIACGGGTVLRPENREALAQNGCILYIKRKTEELARGGRPLSAGDGALEALYEQRHTIYEDFADITVPERRR